MQRMRLQVTLKNIEHGILQLSEPIILLLRIENISEKAVTLKESWPARDFDFEVKNGQKKVFPLWPGLLKIKADLDYFGTALVRLRPGEQREYEVVLNEVVEVPASDT